MIEATRNGPYLVKDLKNLENSRGEPIDAKSVMALCRCGPSSNKPFCDGTHVEFGFFGDKQEGRVPNRKDNYDGKNITSHDNRGVCSHRGHCTDNLSSVFRMRKEPWIDPDTESPDEIAGVI